METRSGALHYPKRGYESFVCGLVHKHGVQYGYGNQKLEEAPRNTKARRLSDTVTSIGGLREGQGLIVEDSGSESLLPSHYLCLSISMVGKMFSCAEPKYFVDPPRLKLLFDMARKVLLSLETRLCSVVKRCLQFEAVKLTLVCMQDISTGVLISENMAAFQEVLWNTTREFADDAAYKDKMTKLLT